MTSQQSIYDDITQRIITQLDAGTIPWRQPWNNIPTNYKSKKAYRGVNLLLLANREFESNVWITFKQCKDAKGHILKGSKGRHIVFWKWFDKDIENDSGEKESKRFALMRQYVVFNVEQTTLEMPEKPVMKDYERYNQAADILCHYKRTGGPEVTFAGNEAYYQRKSDNVTMPPRDTFTSPESFYSTMFHEFTHSTGHESRLDRFTDDNMRFGSNDYSREELIAEFGAAFLCATCQIENDSIIADSAAYIQSWKRKLTDDPKLIVKAASKAQTAVDYITRTDTEGKE